MGTPTIRGGSVSVRDLHCLKCRHPAGVQPDERRLQLVHVGDAVSVKGGLHARRRQLGDERHRGLEITFRWGGAGSVLSGRGGGGVSHHEPGVLQDSVAVSDATSCSGVTHLEFSVLHQFVDVDAVTLRWGGRVCASVWTTTLDDGAAGCQRLSDTRRRRCDGVRQMMQISRILNAASFAAFRAWVQVRLRVWAQLVPPAFGGSTFPPGCPG